MSGVTLSKDTVEALRLFADAVCSREDSTSGEFIHAQVLREFLAADIARVEQPLHKRARQYDELSGEARLERDFLFDTLMAWKARGERIHRLEDRLHCQRVARKRMRVAKSNWSPDDAGWEDARRRQPTPVKAVTGAGFICPQCGKDGWVARDGNLMRCSACMFAWIGHHYEPDAPADPAAREEAPLPEKCCATCGLFRRCGSHAFQDACIVSGYPDWEPKSAPAEPAGGAESPVVETVELIDDAVALALKQRDEALKGLEAFRFPKGCSRCLNKYENAGCHICYDEGGNQFAPITVERLAEETNKLRAAEEDGIWVTRKQATAVTLLPSERIGDALPRMCKALGIPAEWLAPVEVEP